MERVRWVDIRAINPEGTQAGLGGASEHSDKMFEYSEVYGVGIKSLEQKELRGLFFLSKNLSLANK